MPPAQEHNPVVRQLHRMGKQWMAFTEKSDAVLGVWTAEDAETATMIGALPYLEDTEQGIVPSIFLTFDDEFTDPQTYAHTLIKTFLIHLSQKKSRTALTEAGVDIDRITVDEIQDTRAWLGLLSDFTDQVEALDLLSEGHFVAYLNPAEISDREAWKQWLLRLLDSAIPAKVRLMAKEEPHFRWVDEVAGKAPGRLERLQPDLDLDRARQEIVDEAVAADPNDPSLQFRQAMIACGQAAGKKQMDKARAEGERAIAIAQEQDWKHLHIGMLFTLANGYIGIQDFDTAVSHYRKAQEIAQSYEVTAPEEIAMAGQLEVQAIIGEAGCYLGRQDFATAEEHYARAASLAAKVEKQLLELEAWRMAGFCLQQLNDHPRAWDRYRSAWAVGEKTEPDLRAATTLPYVAQALLALRPKAKAPQKQYELEEEIEVLLGKDWELLLNASPA